MKRLLLLLALGAAGCQTSLAPLESRLLQMNPIDVSFTLRSTGAVESASSGTIRAEERDVIVNAETTLGGNTTKRSHALTDHAARVSQKELLILGWTRMGLLHNMVMLASGKPIMHNVGDVRAKEVRRTRGALRFRIEIDGKDVGHAQVWLDERGRPLRRTQTVRFPNGDMQVEETYQWR